MGPRDGAKTGWEQKEEDRSSETSEMKLKGLLHLQDVTGEKYPHKDTACFKISAFNCHHMHSNFIAVGT